MIGALLSVAISASTVMASCATAPATRAAETERLQCDDVTAHGGKLIEHLSILSVRPLYVSIHSSTIGELRIKGAKLLVRPPDGVDANRLLRSAQCHAAKVVLGREKPFGAHDPFRLEGAWLEIDVESEAGNYVVSIAADTITHGLRVLANTEAFARDLSTYASSRGR